MSTLKKRFTLLETVELTPRDELERPDLMIRAVTTKKDFLIVKTSNPLVRLLEQQRVKL